MKKKTLLISGLLLLGAAAGVTSYAVAQSSFGVVTLAEGDEADADVDTWISPAILSPADGAVVGSNVGVSSVYAQFNGGGDRGYSVTTAAGLDILVKRDGEVIKTIPANDKSQVYMDRNWITRMIINFGETLTEPGVYTVEVPKRALETEAFDENGSSIVANEAFSWSFTIKPALSYTVSPRQGSEVSVNQLANFTLTYEEGTEVKVNKGTPTLYKFYANKATEQTTYTVAAEGNVVTLTAVNPAGIATSTRTIAQEYDYLVLPAGLLTLTKGATSYTSDEVTIGNYAPRVISASDFKIYPDPSTPGLTIDDLKVVTVELAEGFKAANLNPLATATAFTVYPSPVYASYAYQYAFKSISEDGRTIVGEMKSATSTNTFTNTTQYCQAGPTVIRFAANQVVAESGAKNAQIDLAGWDLKGIEYAPFYASTPSENSVVTSINGLTLAFPQLVKVENADAEITLSFDGNVVKTVKAGATTTTAAQATGAGNRTVAYANLFKDDNNANFTAPGVYTFSVPAGAYKQVGTEYVNEAKEFSVYIGQNYEGVVKYPVPATYTGTSSNWQCTPAAGSDLTELTSLTLTYPVGTQIELLDGYQYKLQTGGACVTSISYALNNSQSAYPTVKSTDIWGKAEVKDNEIVFTLSNPYRTASPANRATCLTIPGGVFIARIPNGEGGYDVYPNKELDSYYQPLNMVKGRLATPFTKADGAADLQYLGEADGPNYILNDQLSSIIYTGYEPLYPAAVAPKATLTNEDGDVVAEYKGAEPTESLRLSSYNVEFTTTTDLSQLERGIYTFTIAAECLQGGSSTAGSTLATLNKSAFSYELMTLEVNSDVTPATGTEVEGLSEIDIVYNGVSIALADTDIKPTVYYQEKITEGVFAGDMQDIDITTEGYTVEVKYGGSVIEGELDPDEYAINTLAGDDEMGLSNVSAKIVITPALTEEKTYYVHIPAGMLKLETVCGSPSMDLTYNVVAPKTVAFDSAVKRNFPAAEECSLSETYGAMYNHPFGMAAIEISAAQGVTVNTECTEKVQLYYEGTLLAEVGTGTPDESGDGTGIYSTGIGGMDDGVIEWGTTNTYMIMFNPAAPDQFKQLGKYTLKVPEGAFLLNEVPVAAGELNYTLVADKSSWDYSFTPEEGSSLDGATSIVLTIDGVQFVDAEKNCATLVDPEGNTVPWQSAYAGYADGKYNTVQWLIKTGFNDWKGGFYTFTLKAHTVAINGWADEIDPQFPEEDITILYNGATGVSLVGVDVADSYTVYTVDGKAVLVNGTLEQVAELSNGLYIVNGKKALLRK